MKLNQKKTSNQFEQLLGSKLPLPQLKYIVGGSEWYLSGSNNEGMDGCTYDISLVGDGGDIIETKCSVPDKEALGMTNEWIGR